LRNSREIAFFDLRDEDLAVYIMTRKGDSYELQETLFASAKGEGPFEMQSKLEGVGESYLSLPLRHLNFRVLELPFSDKDRIREVLPFELDSLILGGSEGVTFDASIIGESNGRSQVLVSYISKEELRRLLGRLEPLKVDPRIVTSVELASVIRSPSSEEGIPHLLLEPEPTGEEDRKTIAIQEIGNPTINLRRGALSYTADTQKIKKALTISGILGIAVALVITADMGVRIATAKREISSIRGEIRSTYLSVFPQDKKIVNELYQMKAHLKELKEKETAYIGVDPLRLLIDLTPVNRPGVVFNEITVDRERILLKGECPSLSNLQQVKNDLERFLTDVNIADAKPSPSNRIMFTIITKGRK
jgi:type II secretory pathway component PulL